MIQFFLDLRELNEEVEDYGFDSIPEEMQEGDSWKVVPTTVTEADIDDFEKKVNIKLTSEYRKFIGSCAHLFTHLSGKLDNFLYEDDVDVDLEIMPQPYGNELSYLLVDMMENNLMTSLGYIPLGVFNDNGYLYIDTNKENKIVWLPFDNCIGFTTYEEFDNEGFVIFEDFEEFMRCFFLKEVHEVKD